MEDTACRANHDSVQTETNVRRRPGKHTASKTKAYGFPGAPLHSMSQQQPSARTLQNKTSDQKRGIWRHSSGQRDKTAPRKPTTGTDQRTMRSPNSTDATTNGTHSAIDPIITSAVGPTSSTTAVHRGRWAAAVAVGRGCRLHGATTNVDARSAERDVAARDRCCCRVRGRPVRAADTAGGAAKASAGTDIVAVVADHSGSS